MKAEITNKKLEEIQDKIILLPIYEEEFAEKIKSPKTKLDSLIKEVLSETGFKAEYKQLYILNTSGELKSKRILLAGLGKKSEISLDKIRKLYGSALKAVKQEKISSFTAILPSAEKISKEDLLNAVVEGIELGDYSFDKYKSEKKTGSIDKYTLVADSFDGKTLSRAREICDNVKFVRDLVNESGSNLTSLKIVEHAQDIAKEFKLGITIIDEKEMEKLGMNLLLAVGRAGAYPPRLIIMEYKGNPSSDEKAMIVGKGITFDSGGLDIKSASGMETMKMDMAGAGTVLAIMKSIAQRKIRKNIIGVIPTCENMVSSKSYKPGDVLISYSKVSVEVLNTDAEGRLVLGDAIGYGIEKYKPKYIIDLATLTGACLICLGETVAALVTNDDKLGKKVYETGEKISERVWQLPYYDDFKDLIKSDIADIKNIGHGKGYGGTITGASFIGKFVGETPWIHLDIAGTAWAESEKDYQTKGGTGWGVRLLTKFFEDNQ